MFNTSEWSDENWCTLWIFLAITMVGSFLTTITLINNLGFRRAEFLKYQYCHSTQNCVIELDGNSVNVDITEY